VGASMKSKVKGQQILIPDILDGTIPVKREDLKSFAHMCRLHKYLEVVSPTQLYVNHDLMGSEVVKDGFDVRKLIPLLNYDSSMKVFLRAYKGYVDKKGGNYLFNKNLTVALANTRLDLKVKYLPKNFTGFFHLPNLRDNEGDIIKGVFIDINDDFGNNLYLGILVENSNKSLLVAHLNVPLEDKEITVEELIKKHEFVALYASNEKEARDGLEPPKFRKTTEQAEYSSHHATIFNAILYIHNSENLLEKINEFSPKKSKREGQKKVLTQKSFYLVGENFELPKVYTCGEVKVSGHFRWQPYGKGKERKKLIFIDPYKKNYTDKRAYVSAKVDSGGSSHPSPSSKSML